MLASADLLLIAVLVIGGFFVGIYLRIFDTNEMNEKMGLYYSYHWSIFVKPAPKDKSLDIDNTTAKSLAIRCKAGSGSQDIQARGAYKGRN